MSLVDPLAALSPSSLPDSAGLESLLGIHSVEGIREVTEADGTRVILMRLDGEVRAAFVRGSRDLVQVARLRDGRWPFLTDHICQLYGEEMEAAHGEASMVCNFLRREIAGSRKSREHSLVAIDEDRNLIALEICATGPLDYMLLPLNSEIAVRPGTTVQVTVRPQVVTFHTKRMIIGGVPADWIVNDVRIGNRSQFCQSGDVPGDLFGTASIDSFVMFETAQLSINVVVVATYIGTNPEGSPFVGALLGTISQVPSVSLRWTPEGRFEPWLAGSL